MLNTEIGDYTHLFLACAILILIILFFRLLLVSGKRDSIMTGVRSSPAGFYIKLSEPYNFLFANQKYQEIKSLFNIEDSSLSKEEEKALSTNELQCFTRSVVKEGQLKTIEIQVQKIVTPMGENGIVGIVIEPKGIYNSSYNIDNPLFLTNKRNVFKEIIESSDDVIIHLGSDFKVMYISPCTRNTKCSSILNCSCVGESLDKFVIDEDLPKLFEKLALKKPFIITLGIRLYRVERLVEFNMTPIFDNQTFIGYYGIGRDITELAEEKKSLEIKNSIISSMRFILQDLLFSDMQSTISRFLETLGRATKVDRVLLLRTERYFNADTHSFHQEEDPVLQVNNMWDINNTGVHGIPDTPMLHLSEFMGRHVNVIEHHICTKEDKCVNNYLCEGIKVRLIIPLKNVKTSEVLGFLCLDSIDNRKWKIEEVDSVKIAVFNLDAALTLEENRISMEELNKQCIRALQIISA